MTVHKRKCHFSFFVLILFFHSSFGQVDPDLVRALGNHGDRIADLESLVKMLTSGQDNLLQEVTSLRKENGELKAEIKNLTTSCCGPQVNCINTQSVITTCGPSVTETTTTDTVPSTNYFITGNVTLATSSPNTTESSSTTTESSSITTESSPITTTDGSFGASNVTGIGTNNLTTILPNYTVANSTDPITTDSYTTLKTEMTTSSAAPTAPSTNETTTTTSSTTTSTTTTLAPTTTTTTTTLAPTTTTTTTTPAPTTTSKADHVYDSCNEAVAANGGVNGTYNIGNGVVNMKALCVVENGEIWLIIQRRLNGNTDFNRNWTEYEDGFGDLHREFWLGNRNLFYLTSLLGDYTLRIEMDGWGGNHIFAEYGHFEIHGPSSGYMLTVGSYSGTAGDSFHYPQSFILSHHGMRFSTPDKDNDHSPMNCAKELESGWWFNNCYSSNLNGKYLPNAYGQRMLGETAGQPTMDGTGIEWYPYRKRQYSMKRVEMKIKLSFYSGGSLIG